MRATLSFLLALAWLASLGPSAKAITLLQDDRSIDIFSSSGNSSQAPPAPFADWSVAEQTSMVSTTAFSGSGSGFAASDVGFFIRESVFDITFSAAGPTAMTLTGRLSGDDGAFGLGQAKVSLTQGTGVGSVLFSATGGSGLARNFSFGSTLAAGVYRLRVFTELTPGDATGDWSFQASFAAVPEPTAASLLVGTLLVLIGLGPRSRSWS